MAPYTCFATQSFDMLEFEVLEGRNRFATFDRSAILSILFISN